MAKNAYVETFELPQAQGRSAEMQGKAAETQAASSETQPVPEKAAPEKAAPQESQTLAPVQKEIAESPETRQADQKSDIAAAGRPEEEKMALPQEEILEESGKKAPLLAEGEIDNPSGADAGKALGKSLEEAKNSREAVKSVAIGAKAKRFAINGLGRTPKALESFLEETARFLVEAKEIASASPGGEKVREALDKLLSRMEFLAEAKSAVLVQVPALVNGQAAPLELYVFREKSGKKLKKAASALLALDSASLGRIEAYVQKADSSVRVSFRLETGEAAKIAQKGQERLALLLAEAGLSLSGVSFCQMEKPFGLLSREEELSGEKGCQPCTLEARA
jgi:hypothetical protein